MFHTILIRGLLRHLYVGPPRGNKTSSQKDFQTCDVPKKEPSALVVSVEAEDVCEVAESTNQSQKFENEIQDNGQDGNAQMPGPIKIWSGYGLSVVPQWREPVSRQPWPVYRGPESKMVPDKDATEVGVVPSDEKPKLSRRDYLRLMYKEERLKNSKEKRSAADIEWKERQQELEKRMQEAEKDKYVYRSEMSTGQEEKID